MFDEPLQRDVDVVLVLARYRVAAHLAVAQRLQLPVVCVCLRVSLLVYIHIFGVRRVYVRCFCALCAHRNVAHVPHVYSVGATHVCIHLRVRMRVDVNHRILACPEFSLALLDNILREAA